MPTYEMPLLLRVMSKPQVVSTLKRTAEAIFSKGGVIRKIDNLGKQPTPYKIMNNRTSHKEANYFIIHFDIPPTTLTALNKECLLDVDILRSNIYTNTDDQVSKSQCTLHEETLPPAYRPSVQKMMEIGRKQRAKKDKYKFKFNTGLDYYPFQR